MLSSPPSSQKRGKKSAVAHLPEEQYFAPHIGVDEAGRGCLAGPVVAAAAFFPENFAFAARLPGLHDSKQLGESRRDALAKDIAVHASACGIGLAWQDEIDAVNILNATFRAMSRAVRALVAALEAKTPAGLAPSPFPLLLIDGNKIIPQAQWAASFEPLPALPPEWAECLPPVEAGSGTRFPLPEQRAVIDGDALIPAISAASVLAKTFRDSLMSGMENCFPGYGFAKHKGYGTKAHLAEIARKGPCALHRKTFRGVKPEEEQYRLW